jgi:hypothetical protein
MIVLPTLSGAGLTAALLPWSKLRGGMMAQREHAAGRLINRGGRSFESPWHGS